MGIMQKIKSGTAAGISEVKVAIIIASREIGVKVMTDLRQRVLDGK